MGEISPHSNKAAAVITSVCMAFTLAACNAGDNGGLPSEQLSETPVEAQARATFSWGYVESTKRIGVEAAGDSAHLIDKMSGSTIAEIFVTKDGTSSETKRKRFAIGEFEALDGTIPVLLDVCYLDDDGNPLHWNAAEQGTLATEFLNEDGMDTLLSGVRLAEGEDFVRVSPQQVRPCTVDETVDGTEPFWGVWIFASMNEAESQAMADEATSAGFDASIIDSSEWSNLNTAQWFCVTVGRFASEEAAEEARRFAVDSGYSSAYVKYSGDHNRTSNPDEAESLVFTNDFFAVTFPSGEDDWTVEGGITETREAMLDSQGNPVGNYWFNAHRGSNPSVGFGVAVLNFNIPSPPQGSFTFESPKATTIYLVNQGMDDDSFAAIADGFMPV